MIIYHQTAVAGFSGTHIWYWPLQPVLIQRISATSVTVGVPNDDEWWYTHYVLGH